MIMLYLFQAHLPSVRSMSEIANEIAQSTSSLPGSEGGSSLSYSGSSHSLSKISSKSECKYVEMQFCFGALKACLQFNDFQLLLPTEM